MKRVKMNNITWTRTKDANGRISYIGSNGDVITRKSTGATRGRSQSAYFQLNGSGWFTLTSAKAKAAKQVNA